MEQVSEKSTKVELSLGKKQIKNNEYYLKLVWGGIFKINKWTSAVFIFVHF